MRLYVNYNSILTTQYNLGGAHYKYSIRIHRLLVFALYATVQCILEIAYNINSHNLLSWRSRLKLHVHVHVCVHAKAIPFEV